MMDISCTSFFDYFKVFGKGKNEIEKLTNGTALLLLLAR